MMVGRNKRAVGKTIDNSDDNEIEICDDTAPKRRGRGTKKTQQPVIQSGHDKHRSHGEQDNLLAGIDLEGVPEEEKEDLKRALLESQQLENLHHSHTAKVETNNNSTGAQNTDEDVEDVEDVTVIDRDDDQDTSSRGATEMSDEDCLLVEDSPPVTSKADPAACDDVDDDETQPPEDQEEEIGLDFSKGTFNMDMDIDSDGNDVEHNNSQETTKHENSEHYNLHMSVTDDSMEVLDHDSNKTKTPRRRSQDSGGFDPSDIPQSDMDSSKIKQNSQSEVFTTKSNQSGMGKSKDTDYSQSPERPNRGLKSKSQPAVNVARSERSDKSDKGLTGSGNKDQVQQGPSHTTSNTPTAVQSQSSMEKSNSQQSQGSKQTEDEAPLTRHYRAVKRQYVHKYEYFSPPGIDKHQYVKVIHQLFEIYSRKVLEAQRRCGDREDWGQSVKSGQHQAKTVDIKRRGKESVYLELSDEDNDVDDFQEVTKKKKSKKNDSDDDFLPDLIIEKPKNSTTSRRKVGHSSNVQKEDIFSVETQKYDFEENENEHPGNVNSNATASTSSSTVTDGGTKTASVAETVRKARLKRLAKPKVLVEDTQQADHDLDEAIKRSEEDMIISETQSQAFGDDDDWLSINREKNQFGNDMQKAKLKDYAIPKKNNHGSGKVFATAKPDIQLQKTNKETNERKPNTSRGRKRKNEKEASVTLVEDTQDQDDNVNNSNTRRVIRRKCFQIKSDSEDESVPDTQDFEGSPPLSNSEHTPNNSQNNIETKKAKPKGFFSSVMDKVKNMVSPNTKATAANNNSDIEDEDSQSPVIKRSRKLYKEPAAKHDTQVNDEAFDAFKQESIKKKDALHQTVQHNKRPNFVQKIVVDVDHQKGVKRLFSRPTSKESNASDDFSVASSAESSNIFDDKGDIYCTQFGKTRKSSQKNGQMGNEEVQEILNLVDSDEDVMIVKEVKQDYSTNNRKGPNIKITKRKDKVFTKRVWNGKEENEKISQYFEKTKKENSVDIDLDPELNVSKHELSRRSQFGDHDNSKRDMEEDPLECLISEDDLEEDVVIEKGNHANSKNKSCSKEYIQHEKPKVPFVAIPTEVDTKQDIKQFKEDSNHLPYIGPELFPILSKSSVRKSPRGASVNQTTSTIHDVNPPITLQNFKLYPATHVSETERLLGGAKPKVRRGRKISETITNADLDADMTKYVSGLKGRRDQELGNEKEGLESRLRRKRGRVHIDVDEELEEHTIKKKVEMVNCPLCGSDYPIHIIEHHADNCVGPEPDEELTLAEGLHDHDHMEAYLAHHKHLPVHDDDEEAVIRAHHKHLHDHDEEEDMFAHHKHLLNHEEEAAYLANHKHLHDHDEDEEELEMLTAPVNDEHVQTIVESISISPGEEGQVTQCYICDVYIPKGDSMKDHLAQCYRLAMQRQAAVDMKGSHNIFKQNTSIEEEPVTPRTTRRRGQAQEVVATGRDMPPARDEPIKTPARTPEFLKRRGLHERAEPNNKDVKDQNDNEDGYKPGHIINPVDQSDSSTDGSSWTESDSDSDDNITLATVARAGSSALVTGPWNRPKQNAVKSAAQSMANETNAPDWLKNPTNSPIKSFVPISKQEDSEYFQKQFKYKEKAVIARMNKRKRSQSKPKRRRKRRKVRKSKT